ncbi:integrase [Marmoricola sp. URHA0025 HA25]
MIPIGQATTQALLAYLAEREDHPLAHTADLWLGRGPKTFSRDGLYRGLRRRAQRAGVEGFRPHRLRHTAAHRWLAAGGSESGLMAIAGWTRTDMLIRYTRARASERAAAEAPQARPRKPLMEIPNLGPQGRLGGGNVTLGIVTLDSLAAWSWM